MLRSGARRIGLIFSMILSVSDFRTYASHVQAPDYSSVETDYTRIVTTNPFSGMILYRLEYKGNLAVAYRVCFEQTETFPFAIADFAADTLYLDRDRDGHVDEMIAPAHLAKRNLIDELPRCSPPVGTP